MDVSSDAKERVNQVRRLSRWLMSACTVFMVLLPVVLLGYWSSAEPRELVMRANLPPSALTGPLTIAQRLLSAVLSLVPLLLMMIGLLQARRCFAGFAHGRIFTAEAVTLLRRFAGWMALSVMASVVVAALLSAVLTMNNPPGMRHLAVSVGSPHVFMLFFSAMTWLMAAIIGQGQQLADENASFV